MTLRISLAHVYRSVGINVHSVLILGGIFGDGHTFASHKCEVKPCALGLRSVPKGSC